MSSVIVTRAPIASGTASQWQPLTPVGAATAHAALSDSSDATYIESAATLATTKRQRTWVQFAPLALPAGAVIEYVQPLIRERHGVGGWLTVSEIHASNSSGRHKTAWSQAALGSNPADNVWRSTYGPIYTKAADGTEWSDCTDSTFTAVLSWGPNWYELYHPSIVTKPALSKVDLVVSYRVPPTVAITSLGGSITDPRPQVEWDSGETQEAYRLVVVAAGTVDSSGRTAGSVNFNPAGVQTKAYDSGKVYSAVETAVVQTHLPPGSTYYIYVRVWSPGIGSREMPSLWGFVGPLSIATETVQQPLLTLTADNDTYTVRATVTRQNAQSPNMTPTFYALQRLTSNGWEDVQGAQRLSGSGPWAYFDGTHAANETVKFRARGVYQRASGTEVPTSWVEATYVVPNRGEWWLRDPADHTMNTRIEVASYAETIPKPQEVAYGAGAKGATVTHQGVRLGVHKTKIRCLDADNYQRVRALLETGRTLFLVSVFGEAWRVQLAESTEVEIIRAEPLDNETTPIRNARVFTCNFIEVER